MKKLLLFPSMMLMLMVSFNACKREGCTDPKALNYDEKARNDNGTCIYEEPPKEDSVLVIKDTGSGTGTTKWTSDKTYILDGLVFVNSGQTLTIEAGTVIKGKSGTGENASALIVAKGGKIMADGTAAKPIIFTFENDPLDGSIPVTTRGQWGGVIILGNASLNSSPGTTAIEGIPTTETRGIYGGTNDADNSGTFRYVSIRHGGTDIGAGNEINGLTLGGVGSGTTIEYIEVIANADDGVEFFGGTANTKYVVTAYCGDDSFDYDEGFRGKGQFWFTLQDPAEGDRGGEHDGGTSPEDGMPYATPKIYNATYAGRGMSEGTRALTFRDNAGGEYHNSIFIDWGKGFDIENLASGEDSYNRFLNNQLKFAGNVFYNVAVNGAGATAADIFKVVIDTTGQSVFQASFNANGNTVADPGIIHNLSAGTINPVPSNASNVSNAIAPSDGWYSNVTYKGAFAPGASNWAKGWTLIDKSGKLQ